jgi:hypothetical protein
MHRSSIETGCPAARPARGGRLARVLCALVAVALATTGGVSGAGAQSAGTTPTAGTGAAPTCGADPVTMRGTVTATDAKTYQLHPFVVPPGTAQVEVSYTWDPVDKGVLDLGVYDNDGTKGPAAFRSWAGSRQGRIDKDMAPLVIAPDRNERTVSVGPIDPGTWNVELGIAAVDAGATLAWRVVVRCPPGPAAPRLAPDPVDPTHVARAEPGWFAGDFHLHAYHSSPDGPDPEAMLAKARAAGLDIVPVTEYVTPAHWDRLGALQRAHPDVLIWPGREIITYFGHMIVLNETRGAVDYRVGYDGITVADLQRAANAEGGIVGLAHPTIFPPAQFGSLCRGCYFEKLDEVDWSAVTMMEVVTSGVIADVDGVEVPNPFADTAVELWESELRQGHRLTAVSGSDDKPGDHYGKTSTMVWAKELSRPAVDEALRLGHAYVRGLGKLSPTLELQAKAPDGATAMFGDTLTAATAELTLTARGGVGHQLTVRRDGTEVQRVPITSDPFVYTTTIERGAEHGPLGTFWGAEIRDLASAPGRELRTVIANPVFLNDVARTPPKLPTFVAPAAVATSGTTPPAAGGAAGVAAPATATAASGASLAVWIVIGAVVLAALAAVGVVVARRSSSSS